MTETDSLPSAPWVRQSLRCPVTGTELEMVRHSDGSAWLHNTDTDRPLAYPVREGVPVLLADQAQVVHPTAQESQES